MRKSFSGLSGIVTNEMCMSLQKIYRYYMDKVLGSHKVQEISVHHTKELFDGDIGILFYDMTTLYFETTDKDELHNKRLFEGQEERGPAGGAGVTCKPRQQSAFVCPVQRSAVRKIHNDSRRGRLCSAVQPRKQRHHHS